MGLLSNVLKQAGKSAKDAVEVENIVKQNNLKVKRIKKVDPDKPANPRNLLSKMNEGQRKAYNLIKRSLPGKKLMLYGATGGGLGVAIAGLGIDAAIKGDKSYAAQMYKKAFGTKGLVAGEMSEFKKKFREARDAGKISFMYKGARIKTNVKDASKEPTITRGAGKYKRTQTAGLRGKRG